LWCFQQAEKNWVEPFKNLLYQNRAEVYLNLHDYQSAINEYSRLIIEQPQNGDAYLSRGKAWMEVKGYKDAIVDFKRGIDLIKDKTQLVDAYSILSMAYILTGNFDEALNSLNSISLTKSENKKLVYILKAISLTGKFEYKKALQECNEYLKLDASNPMLFRYRGLLHLILQDYSLALDDFIKVVELYPNVPDSYVVLKTDVVLGDAINYDPSKLNNLILYRDTTINSVDIAIVIDNGQKDILLNKLIELINNRIEKSSKKSYLLKAEFRKSLSDHLKETLDDYDKAIAEDVNSGVAFYLRGKFQIDFLKNTEQGCLDIAKSRNLGIKTDDCPLNK
jgi:tetratricopeptide (TPR) repeat protein